MLMEVVVQGDCDIVQWVSLYVYSLFLHLTGTEHSYFAVAALIILLSTEAALNLKYQYKVRINL
jgi:hypothetical protein